jgi:sugar phosphate isomerase/epimerase
MHQDRQFSRRTLLSKTVRAAAFAALVSPVTPLLAASSRWFKIGIIDGMLKKSCDPSVFDVAKRIGLDGVQVDIGQPGHVKQLGQPELQKKFLAASQRTGVEIASLCVSLFWQAPVKSDPRGAPWLCDCIDICKALGLPIILVPCFDLEPSKAGEIDQFSAAIRHAAAKAEKQGIVLGLENWLSAEDNMRVIEGVGSPAVKVYYDVGNSTGKGRDVCREIRKLGKLICELHAKDGPHMLGQGRIDFRNVRKALDDIQYSGWLQIEAAAPHGMIPDYTADCTYLKGIFPRTVD